MSFFMLLWSIMRPNTPPSLVDSCWTPWLLHRQATVCCFLSLCAFFIGDEFGSDLNEIWPTSTCLRRVDRWNTPVICTVREHSDLSDSPSESTVNTGDNGARYCSQVECCYLYANEWGSNNFISIKKQPITILSLHYFSMARYFLCWCAYIYLDHSNEKRMMEMCAVDIMPPGCFVCDRSWEFKEKDSIKDGSLYNGSTEDSGGTDEHGGTKAWYQRNCKKYSSKWHVESQRHRIHKRRVKCGCCEERKAS